MSERKKIRRASPRFRKVAHPKVYGEPDIALSNVKVNIHIRLDAGIVNYFKEKASREGGKYQALINQHLRDTIFEEKNLEGRLRHIEERLGIH